MGRVEKVARAMCVAGGYSPDEIMPNDGPRWRYYVPGTEAAIAKIEGETWEHTKTGQKYLIIGSCLNVITDHSEVLYSPLYTSDFQFFTRQLRGDSKSWMSKNDDGTPRFKRIS